LWLGAALLLGCARWAAAQTRYAVTSTGIYFSPVAGISATGMIAGQTSASYAWDARDGLMQIPGLGGGDTYAWSMNVSDQVVGGSHPVAGSSYIEAFVWDKANGTRQIASFGCQSEAKGINNRGDIAGFLDFPPDGVSVAPFLWRRGQGWVRLAPLVSGQSSGAEHLNDNDEIVGDAQDASGADHMVIWNPNGTMTDMGNMPPQYQNYPSGINDRGVVCGFTFGYLSGALGFVSYIWSPSTGYVPLFDPYNATYSINAVGINNQNTVVGRLDDTQGSTEGFVWTQAGGFTMINDHLDPGSAGWNVTEVDAINDAGQMAGVGYVGLRPYAVLITPVGPAPVSGTVTLGNYPAGPAGVLVTVQLYNAGTATLADTENATLDSGGNFTVLTQAPPGSYDVYVKASHWLRRKLANQLLTASGLSGLAFPLINGDINGDNTISLADFGALKQAYGSMLWDANWNQNADLDGNGSVGLSDFGILKLNYGMSGD